MSTESIGWKTFIASILAGILGGFASSIIPSFLDRGHGRLEAGLGQVHREFSGLARKLVELKSATSQIVIEGRRSWEEAFIEFCEALDGEFDRSDGRCVRDGQKNITYKRWFDDPQLDALLENRDKWAK